MINFLPDTASIVIKFCYLKLCSLLQAACVLKLLKISNVELAEFPPILGAGVAQSA
jgi:hypothetical protein